MNHRMPPEGTLEEQFALRHKVIINENSIFEQIFGTNEVMVNSLHGLSLIHI